MRLKKKCAIIISVIILCFLIIGVKKSNLAASVDRFYMTGKSIDENTMEVKVFLETEHTDTFRGVISYDKELVLKEIRTNLNETVYKPNLETEGEKSYKGAKGLSFSYMCTTENAISGTKAIITLVYDISNCEEGKGYSINWDTENLSGSGNNTYTSYNQEYRDVQAEGFNFDFTDDNGSDEDEQKKKEQEEASRKAEEEARKKAEEEARKKAEEEAKKKEEEENKKNETFEATISYDVTTPTSGRVTAIITANKKLKAVDGWTASEDGKVLTKVYSENKTETIKVEDEDGNKKSIEVKIENIVKTSPDAGKNNTANNSTKNNTAKNNTSNNTSKNNSSNQANKNYPQTGSSTTIIIGAAIAFIVIIGGVAFIKARKL